MDNEKIAPKVFRMWWKLAGICERMAYQAAEKDMPHKALHFAKCAEAYYWQSTGEADSIGLKDLT